MKKHFIFLLAAVLVLSVQKSEARIDLGVVGGMNLNNVSFHKSVHDNLRSDNRCGWFVGPKLEVTLPLAGLGFDVSAQYTQRYVNASYDNGVEGTRTLKTVEVPVNLLYRVGSPKLVAAYFATGPQFGFNVGNGSMKWSTNEYKIKNAMLSWNVGAGLRVLSHIEVGVSYNIGLTKIARMVNFNESVKSNSFQAHVGYFF